MHYVVAQSDFNEEKVDESSMEERNHLLMGSIHLKFVTLLAE